MKIVFHNDEVGEDFKNDRISLFETLDDNGTPGLVVKSIGHDMVLNVTELILLVEFINHTINRIYAGNTAGFGE